MPEVFVATTGPGIARALCGPDGVWSVQRGLDGVDVRCLASDPLRPGILYAGTDRDGVLRSDDRGETWQPAGLPGQRVRSIAASPTRPGVVYAGVKPPGVFASYDGGASWRELEGFRRKRQWWWFTPAEPGSAYVQAIALSPTDPDVLLTGIEVGGVLRSEDGGATWSGHCRAALRDCHTLTFHATHGDWVYQGGGGGAAVSRDGGRTWSRPRRGLDRFYGWAVSADPADPETWYASLSPSPFKAHGDRGAEAYIFRSSGGSAWERIAGPLDAMPYGLISDPAAPGRLMAGLHDGQVIESLNRGGTWRTLPFALGRIARVIVRLAG